MIFIAYHPCYELELPRGHRFPMDKYPMLRKQLIYEGTFSKENFFVPKKIDRNIKDISLDELPIEIDKILEGKQIGRVRVVYD